MAEDIMAVQDGRLSYRRWPFRQMPSEALLVLDHELSENSEIHTLPEAGLLLKVLVYR